MHELFALVDPETLTQTLGSVDHLHATDATSPTLQWGHPRTLSAVREEGCGTALPLAPWEILQAHTTAKMVV